MAALSTLLQIARGDMDALPLGEIRLAIRRLRKDVGSTIASIAALASAIGLPELATPEYELGRCDMLIALGGDGTVLAANRLASPHGTPILGIHAGGPASFGFLT